MKRSPFHISSWVFSAFTFSVVGLTPLYASGVQEIGMPRADALQDTGGGVPLNCG